MLTLATKFIPVRSGFETAFAAGYRAAEFWLNARLLADSEKIAELAKDFPFRYALHFPNDGHISDEGLEATISLYQRLECSAVIIHQPMFDLYARKLIAICPDVRLAIENHVLDKKGVERWAERSSGLTLDVEHLWKFTWNDGSMSDVIGHVERILEQHAEKLYHIHLPGYRPGGEEHLPIHNNCEFAAEVMNRLSAHGFTQLVVSEADTPYQTRDFLVRDVEFFERWKASLPRS